MRRLVTALLLLAAAGGGGYYYFTYSKQPEKPQVVQATISQGNITEQVQATGTLEALRTVTVGPQVSGTIQWLGADFNQIVKAGQVVARLDPSLLQVQVDIQTANIERQETDIESQKVQLEDANRSLVRTKELFEKGLANQTQLEQADLTVKTRVAQIASAQKQLVQARANLAQANLNLSYTEVKSPIDGVVVNRRVDVGQTVQSSMNVAEFFQIATDLRMLKLTAGVDEAEIGKVLPDMPVIFTVDSYPGQQFHGTVNAVRLNATTNQNVVTYPVWIDAPNPDLKLRPNLTANVRIIISSAENVIRIPNQALRFRPTTDVFTALGLTPPAAGRGNPAGDAGGRRGRGADGNGDATGAGGSTAAQPGAGGPQAPGQGRSGDGSQRAARTQGGQGGGQSAQGQGGQGRQPGQNGQGGQGGGRGSGGGQGFGRGSYANMSPEDRQRMMDQLGIRGGGRGGQSGQGGGARGGRGGQGGGRGQQGQFAGGQGQRGGRPGGNPADTPGGIEAPNPTGLPPLTADKIDELFQPTPTRIQGGSVWTWDEANKKLTEIRVRTGITDNQFSQLIDGDVKVGQQVVTSVLIPLTTQQRNQQNIFGNQPNRGFGGMQPGGPGGPGGGGGDRGGGGARGGGGGRN